MEDMPWRTSKDRSLFTKHGGLLPSNKQGASHLAGRSAQAFSGAPPLVVQVWKGPGGAEIAGRPPSSTPLGAFLDQPWNPRGGPVLSMSKTLDNVTYNS